MKQNHLISTVTSPKLSKESFDFLVMFVRLYVEQVAGRKPQTIDNREKNLIRRIHGTIFYTLNYLDRNADLVREFLLGKFASLPCAVNTVGR